jgi:hypothetical protein
VDDFFSFRSQKNPYTSDIESNINKISRIYLPTDLNCGWDCIYDDGIITAFFSFSINHYDENNPRFSRIEESFKINGKRSEVSHILSKIRGKEGYQVEIQKKKLRMKGPDGNELNDVHFVLGCGKNSCDIAKRVKHNEKFLSYDFLKFFGRNEMENQGIKF